MPILKSINASLIRVPGKEKILKAPKERRCCNVHCGVSNEGYNSLYN